MPENTILYKIMVAFPSDANEYIDLIQKSILQWNSENGSLHNSTLQLVNWKTNSTPEIGEHPQKILNRQLVETCDILIAIFWSRFGTPTDEYLSGTEEEIVKFEEAGKPIHLYFSDEGVAPHKIDTTQLKKVQEFRKKYKTKGIVYNFVDRHEFVTDLHRHLTYTIVNLKKALNKNKDDIKIINERLSSDYSINNKLNSQPIGVILPRSFERLEENITTYNKNQDTFSSGFKDLDYIMAGCFKKKSIYTIYGYLGTRKSSFLRSLILNFIHTNIPCIVVSIQESAQDFTECLLCMEADIQYLAYYSLEIPKRKLPNLATAAGTLSEANLYILANPTITTKNIIEEMNKICTENVSPIIIIDDYYRLFVNESGSNLNTNYATLAATLKSIAHEFNTTIIGVHPLFNESISSGGKKRPTIADIDDSFPMFEYSSGVLFLHPRSDLKIEGKEQLIELIVAKNQYGPIGTIELSMGSESNRITDLSNELHKLIEEDDWE